VKHMRHLSLLLMCMTALPALAVVSPTTITLKTVIDGPVPAKPVLKVNTPDAWTLAISTTAQTFVRVDGSWAFSAKGTGPADVRLVVTRVPPVGTHSGQISVTTSSGVFTVPVTFTVVQTLAQPKFSSALTPGSPRDCKTVPGFSGPAPDCAVPDVSPTGAWTPGPAWADHNFGGYMRLLTPYVTMHGYASPSAISARNKYVLLKAATGFHAEILTLADGRSVHSDPTLGFQGIWWDAFDDEVFYAIKGTQIRAFSMITRKWSVVVDYTGRFTSINNGGTGDTSKDNWVAFYAQQEQTACALNLLTRKTYCHRYGSLGDPAGDKLTKLAAKDVDFPMISKGVDRVSGMRYVVLAAAPVMVIYAVDESTGTLRVVGRGPELSGGNGDGVCDAGEHCLSSRHGDVFQSSDGQQWYMTALDTVNPTARNLVSLRLSSAAIGLREELGGGLRKIMTLFPGGTQWLDLHVGCAKYAPTCVVSMQTNIPVQPAAALNIVPNGGQLFAVRNNNEVRQLGFHRSVQIIGESAGSYWSRARACISGDARYVLFTSNFGRMNQQRPVLLEMGIWPSASYW
jgi:hypothetical protein